MNKGYCVLLGGIVATTLASSTVLAAGPAPLPQEVRQAVASLRWGAADPAISRLSASGQLLTEQTARLLGEIQAEENVPDKIAASRSLLPGTLQQWQTKLLEARQAFRAKNLQNTPQVQEIERRFAAVVQALQQIMVTAAANPPVRSAAIASAHGVLAQVAVPGANQLPPLPTPMSMPPPPEPLPQSTSKTRPAYLSYGDASPMYAFLGNTLLAAAPPIPTEASNCTYTAADLSKDTLGAGGKYIDSDEIQLATGSFGAQELQNLAATLNYSPARIFQYVANEIAFEPYFGSLKGAIGTLYAKSGNATDHASLLIALLRASNIPARYVRGNIEVAEGPTNVGTASEKNARVNRWVGGKTYKASAAILSAGGVPGPTDSGRVRWFTTVNGVAFTHVWVEACVPYGHYRGVSLDNIGHRWVPLDPSFKDQTYQAGRTTNSVFPYTDFLSKRTPQLPVDRYEQVLRATLPANVSVEDIGYVGSVVTKSFDVLPIALPYSVIDFLAWDAAHGFASAETAVLPPKHRYQLKLTAKRGSDLAVQTSATLSMPKYILSRITLSPTGDAANQPLLSRWQGGDANVQPADVQVLPVIKAEGIVVSTSPTASVNLDSRNNILEMMVTLDEINNVQSPWRCGQAQVVTANAINCVTYSNIAAADYNALQAYGGQASDRLLLERTQLLALNLRNSANPDTALESTIGEFLNLAGLKFMRYASDAYKRLGELDGGSGLSSIHLGLAAAVSQVDYVLGTTFQIAAKSYKVDMPGMLTTNVDLVSGSRVWKTFLLAGYAGSAYEHAIWQEMLGSDAVSTVHAVQFANETNVGLIRNISSANWATVRPTIACLATPAPGDDTYPCSQLDDPVNGIVALINAGWTVHLPKKRARYGDWRGLAYLGELDLTATPNSIAKTIFAFTF